MTGPTPEFVRRYSRACQAPLIMGLGLEGVAALNERVIAAETFEGLSVEDRRLILRAEQEVAAGLSPTLQDPEDWDPDWMATDAALDDPLLADDDAGGDDESGPEGKGYDLDFDSDEWVGL